MSNTLIGWKKIPSVDEFDQILERSKTKPALLLKYHPSSSESVKIKKSLEDEWSIPSEMLDAYLVDMVKDDEVATEATEVSGVPDEEPQIFLFADGVTMYDESGDMINVKKIKIALKIINRTFKWLETRV